MDVKHDTGVKMNRTNRISGMVAINQQLTSIAGQPATLRQLMAFSFGVKESDIEVHIPFVGGGFGGKAGIHLEPLLTLLSRASGGAPVRRGR